MSFYPKKIRNLKDLEKEKLKLQEQLKKMDATPILPTDIFKGINLPTSKENAGKTALVPLLLSFLPVGKNVVAIIKGLLPDKHNNIANSFSKPIVKKLLAAAKTVLLGFLKWKAIELTYKAVQKAITAHKKPATKNEQ